jgi:hypothetical protein
MADDLIAVARQQLAAVERDIQDLQARAANLRSFIKTGAELTASIMCRESGDGISVTVELPQRPAEPGSLIAMAEALEPIGKRAVRAVKVLLQESQPRTARQLVEALKDQGVTIGGSDPPSNLAAILSQNKNVFRNVRGQGYFLADTQNVEPDDAPTSSGSVWLDPATAPDRAPQPQRTDAEGGYGYGEPPYDR